MFALYGAGPAMAYGAECWAIREKGERTLYTTEMRMLRGTGGNTRLDHVRNVDIWKEAYNVPDSRIPQREEVEMAWTCREAR